MSAKKATAASIAKAIDGATLAMSEIDGRVLVSISAPGVELKASTIVEASADPMHVRLAVTKLLGEIFAETEGDRD